MSSSKRQQAAAAAALGPPSSSQHAAPRCRPTPAGRARRSSRFRLRRPARGPRRPPRWSRTVGLDAGCIILRRARGRTTGRGLEGGGGRGSDRGGGSCALHPPRKKPPLRAPPPFKPKAPHTRTSQLVFHTSNDPAQHSSHSHDRRRIPVDRARARSLSALASGCPPSLQVSPLSRRPFARGGPPPFGASRERTKVRRARPQPTLRRAPARGRVSLPQSERASANESAAPPAPCPPPLLCSLPLSSKPLSPPLPPCPLAKHTKTHRDKAHQTQSSKPTAPDASMLLRKASTWVPAAVGFAALVRCVWTRVCRPSPPLNHFLLKRSPSSLSLSAPPPCSPPPLPNPCNTNRPGSRPSCARSTCRWRSRRGTTLSCGSRRCVFRFVRARARLSAAAATRRGCGSGGRWRLVHCFLSTRRRGARRQEAR